MRYFLSKLWQALLTLWGVTTVIFLLFTVLPGDPARMMLDQNEDSAQLAAIKKKYGFDKPLSTQYVYYLNDISPISFHGNSPQGYTYFDTQKYNGVVLIKASSFSVALKTPYLRESFQKN